LITGGLGGTSNTANSVLNGAEIYDPATGTFTFTTGSLNYARYNHYAILLYTGKVLIAGGVGTNSVWLNSAELYDPATNTFATTGSMITARSGHFLTRLPNGKVLVSNGSDAAGNPIQALEIYDPATGTFTAAGNGLAARSGGRVYRLANGKIILVGGQTTSAATSVTNSAELYSQVTGRFSATGSLITGRQGFAQSGLPNGRILAAGGAAGDGGVLSSAELYTPLIADEVDTTITSGPDPVTSSTTATFSFTSTDPNSTFTCSLDGSPFAACTSGQTYSSLANGPHNFQVHATDSLGNTDPTPANYDWTIAPCAYTISPTNKTFTAKGGSVSVKVSGTGQTNCPAPSIVVEDAEWISVSGTPTWKANKETVKIAVQQNPSSQSRTGVISIGGQNLTIQEDGAICKLTALTPSSGKYPNTGGSGSFDITVSPQDCGWNVATTLDWIHLDTTTGTGNGTAAFHMDANGTGKNRAGKINVSLTQNPTKKKTFTVNESK
jgi:hypothetical protein